jgi:hypothetical protein
MAQNQNPLAMPPGPDPALKRLERFPLGQIAAVPDDPQWQLPAAVQRHLDHTRRRAAAAERLGARLAKLAAELDRCHDPSPGSCFWHWRR